MHEGFGRGNSVPYANNIRCLKNFINSISNKQNLTIFLDNSSDPFYQSIKGITDNVIIRTSLGNSRSFLNCVNHSIQNLHDEEIVYFVENDYIHMPEIEKFILDGFSVGATFVSLYDHRDWYINNSKVLSRLHYGTHSHWRTIPSTCMTFATKIKNLKKNISIINKNCSTQVPEDHQMFLDLQNCGEILVTPVPGRCTHAEINYLSPLINWELILNGSS